MTNPARELLLGPRPAVIACLTTHEHLERLPEIQADGADIAEFRADCFPELEEIDFCCVLETIRSFMPVIFTIRSVYEGGYSEKSSEERQFSAHLLLKHMDVLDIEAEDAFAERMAQEAAGSNVVSIASQHFVDGMPPNDMFEQALRNGKRTEADIIKIACRLRNKAEQARLGSYMLMTGKQNCMLMGMGEEYGANSRILAIATGAPGVYTTPEHHASKAAVPGQLTVRVARAIIDACY